MQCVFKSMLVAAITVLGAALTIVPAQAQSGRVLVNIPFEFSVGNTTLKAGSYKVERLDSGIIAVSSEDGKEHKFVLTVPGNSEQQGHEPRLVFIRYGSEAFLKKVFLSTSNDCDELPKSSRERELIKSQASGAELSLLLLPGR
jgi:hypothetical protein